MCELITYLKKPAAASNAISDCQRSVVDNRLGAKGALIPLTLLIVHNRLLPSFTTQNFVFLVRRQFVQELITDSLLTYGNIESCPPVISFSPFAGKFGLQKIENELISKL